MKRTTRYVGLDVHQEATVASVREQRGRMFARAILPTESSALTEFFSGMRGSVHVAFGLPKFLGHRVKQLCLNE